MKVVFRADASSQVGTGHIMRCRTLAHALRQRGASVHFICREEPGHLADLLRGDGIAVDVLPATAPFLERDDAAQTIKIIADQRPDWLVADHYGIAATWESQLRSVAKNILAINDLADRAHVADVLLDQNFSAKGPRRYDGLIPAESRALLGPRYALLGEAYTSIAPPVRERVDRVRRILVYFGGADADNMTGVALAALTDPQFDGIHVDVVLGLLHPARQAVEALARTRANTTVHGPRGSLIDFLSNADLAIGAGGTTTWERCYMGVPTVVVAIADNQVPGSRDLAAAGVIEYVGMQQDLKAETLRRAIAGLCADPVRRQMMAEQGQVLVDGRGAARVAETILRTGPDDLTLRPAQSADCGFLFQLANDPDVRRESFQGGDIPWPDHKAWFARKLQDKDTQLLILTVQGLPVGQIRFDYRDGEALLSYSLEPFVRGRRWASVLVALGVARSFGVRPLPVKAEVKSRNTASCRVFEKLGFHRIDDTPDKITYRLQPP